MRLELQESAQTFSWVGSIGGTIFTALTATTQLAHFRGRPYSFLPAAAVGPGLDGLAIDEKRKRIVTSNGDGTMTVIAQKGADDYELLGTVSTRTEARMRFMDERNGNLYFVTADSTTSKLDADRATLYFDLILHSLSEVARRELQTMNPIKYEYRSDFALVFYFCRQLAELRRQVSEAIGNLR